MWLPFFDTGRQVEVSWSHQHGYPNLMDGQRFKPLGPKKLWKIIMFDPKPYWTLSYNQICMLKSHVPMNIHILSPLYYWIYLCVHDIYPMNIHILPLLYPQIKFITILWVTGSKYPKYICVHVYWFKSPWYIMNVHCKWWTCSVGQIWIFLHLIAPHCTS